MDEITTIAEKIKGAFTTPFDTESGEVFTTTSVGITIYPFDDQDRDEYQGYLFSKPIPGAAVLPLIQGHQLKLARNA